MAKRSSLPESSAPPAKKAKAGTSTAAPAPKKKAGLGDLEAIFSAKKKAKASAEKDSSEAVTAASKGKGKEKQADQVEEQSEPAGKQGKKKKQKGKAVDTPAPKADPKVIVDSSAAVSRAFQQPVPTGEADEAFMDSRGTRKFTEDGLPIYSVEELKIGLGGDTPLCPFDCDCCF